MRDARMTIRFLIANAFSVGGTIRTTFMTAAGLADEHDVEVVSVYRLADEPKLELDPRVTLRTLTDLRPAATGRAARAATRTPSRLIPPDDARYPMFNLLTDAALLRFLRTTRDGVLVGTRPGLNLAMARYGRRSVVHIGQDHMNLGYRPELLRALAESYPRLDAVTALTEGTAAGYRELVGAGTRVVCIPNPAPPDAGRRASPDSRVVVAAGGLTRRKGFDRLLKAWAALAPDHPGWRLRIFGDGPDRAELEQLIDDLGIRRSVQLRGYSGRILEAMSAGLPVVAYDCPTGPRDIVSEGVDGHVVPNGRTRLLVESLGGLMGDADRRRRYGAAALEKAAQYRIDVIAARWNALFEELAAAKGVPATGSRRGGATARARA